MQYMKYGVYTKCNAKNSQRDKPDFTVTQKNSLCSEDMLAPPQIKGSVQAELLILQYWYCYQ